MLHCAALGCVKLRHVASRSITQRHVASRSVTWCIITIMSEGVEDVPEGESASTVGAEIPEKSKKKNFLRG